MRVMWIDKGRQSCSASGGYSADRRTQLPVLQTGALTQVCISTAGDLTKPATHTHFARRCVARSWCPMRRAPSWTPPLWHWTGELKALLAQYCASLRVPLQGPS